MRFDILTLFPEIIAQASDFSILKRAKAAGRLDIAAHDIRRHAGDNHGTVDDTPYGGGAGMVLKVDVMDRALQAVLNQPEVAAIAPEKRRVVLLTPQGERVRQPRLRALASECEQITFICGHYEGFDERIRSLVDLELSLGDFVLTGGELPALVLVDGISRLLPEVLGHPDSPEEESFSLTDEAGQLLLEYPHYTRPASYKGLDVPEILLSGNHGAIAAWRLEQAKIRTHNRNRHDQ